MTAHIHGDHEPWDELVAGHALHALEPTEQLRLLGHVDGCSFCRNRLDEFTLVAAQLGSLGDDTVEPPSWAAVRPPNLHRPVAPPSSAAGLAPVVPLRRRLAGRAVSTAAAAVVVVAVVVAGWQLSRTSSSRSTTTAAMEACRQQSGCRIVALHGQHGDNAAVLVEAGRASLVPVEMPALSSGRMYVLWQMPRDGSPIPVVTFRDARRQTTSVPLAAGYSDTAAFAVSLEPAGPMPTHPTDVLAVGAATG